MPELPEVETVVRELRRRIVGKTIDRVRVHWERSIHGRADEFRRRLANGTVRAVSRRGKFIGFELQDGTFFTIHLRMTGRLVQEPNAADKKHVRIEFRFRDGSALHFVDARKFGRLRLWPCKSQSCPGLGPEPLRAEMVRGTLQRLTTRRPLKTVLLDQTVLAGVGNIYADESLFAAGIHPLTPACQLDDGRREKLSRVLPDVLRGAIQRNGTTLRDYRTVAGARGENRERLQAYGRTGQPCFVCGATIEKIRISGRSAHFCPHCQRSLK